MDISVFLTKSVVKKPPNGGRGGKVSESCTPCLIIRPRPPRTPPGFEKQSQCYVFPSAPASRARICRKVSYINMLQCSKPRPGTSRTVPRLLPPGLAWNLHHGGSVVHNLCVKLREVTLRAFLPSPVFPIALGFFLSFSMRRGTIIPPGNDNFKIHSAASAPRM